MRKVALSALLVLANLLPLSAKITFANPVLNDENQVMFSVKHDVTGSNSYSSIFISNLQEDNLEQCGKNAALITYFPEQMEILNLMGKNVLQIRNRYGTARYYSSTEFLSWKDRKTYIPETASLTLPYAPSADGKWTCFVRKDHHATGTLILESTTTGNQYIIAENVLLNYQKVPVKWSPDGTILFYAKKGNIYFCRPEAIFHDVEVDEKYRILGRGTIESVEWASAKQLIYIDDCMVYSINARELYTLGLYSDIIGKGTPVGRLPFHYNELYDSFSVSPDGKNIVIAQNGKNFTFFKTRKSSCDYMDIGAILPYVDSTATLIDYRILWESNDSPVLWQNKIPNTGTASTGYFFRMTENMKVIVSVPDCGRPSVSPDGKKVMFSTGKSLCVYDFAKWKKIGSLDGEKIISALWESNSSIYVGGEETIRIWKPLSREETVIALSAAESAFWDDEGRIISDISSGECFQFMKSSGCWQRIEKIGKLKTDSQNPSYRVYCGTTPNKNFGNALYVRRLSKEPLTKALFPECIEKTSEKNKVALVFDAYDNADGIPEIIGSLRRFGVTGTFFLNGEFIRRYPGQTKQISMNGYECASMFFTTSNLTDSGTYKIDGDFIRRGLGRTEDEFLSCTGNELSLYWHAPFYLADDEIISAGNAAGYTYVPSIHIHTDIVMDENNYGGHTYVKPEILIEEYVNMVLGTGGGMVPVTVGLSKSSMPETLWENTDLLIYALLDAGFELVKISDL